MLGAWSLHNLSQMYLRFASPGNKDDFHLSRAVNCLEEAYALVLQALGPEAEQVRCGNQESFNLLIFI